ncbi:hypothetical protein SEA_NECROPHOXINUS_126 [Microbacterium phage Necrophoxinus]|nr:hypothetical protein SEA_NECROPHOXINUS_10 [Microbacterium phage Necrophoxinus]QWS69487.1 hypothetical protein SEA_NECROPHOXINUS_126 [Microbacterium phage Necrophoxinus]
MSHTISTVDTTHWTTDERMGVDYALPYVVTAAPYGESIITRYATEAEAHAEVRAYAAMTGEYLTSWGYEPVNTGARIAHYVIADTTESAVTQDGFTISSPILDRGVHMGTYRPIYVDGLLVGEIMGIRTEGDLKRVRLRVRNGYDYRNLESDGRTVGDALMFRSPEIMAAFREAYPNAR